MIFINELKSSALFSVIIGKRLGLDWLVRSHSRISVGASRDPIWVVTFSCKVLHSIFVHCMLFSQFSQHFSSCLFVECSKRAVIFDSTVTQASLTTSEIQGELMLLAWTGSSSSCLDALKLRHGLAFHLF